MKYRRIENNIIIEELNDFDLEQTLECGQCFRFEKLMNHEYIIVAHHKILRIKQNGMSIILYDTSLHDFETIWKEYFDLERNYNEIKSWLLSKDDKLKDSIHEKNGVRILNQDFFEILITFIISQNKQIPHIKQIVEILSQKYGEPIGTVNNKTYYSFPDVQRLSKVSEEEFRECKVGFRARYIVDACKKVANGEIDEKSLRVLESNHILEKLLTIKGVGEKIANCVLLFGLSRRESFPIDVWVKRIMEKIYFEKETKKEIIQEYAKEHFGEYGGYAQQYLFYYARDQKLKN